MNRNHYHKAKKRVKKVKSFYSNLFAWAVMSVFFVILNLYTMGPMGGHFWAIYPILGWGLGIAFQAYEVFGFGKDWEDKMILEEMQKQREKEEARVWKQNRTSEPEIVDDLVPLDDELELKEFRKIRKEWDEQDFV